MRAVSRALSTERNKSAVFHQNHLYYNLSAIILQKESTLKKKKFFRIFGNYREFLGNIRQSQKNSRAFFGEIPERLGRYISRIM